MEELFDIEKATKYEVIAEGKGTLRLYINDPAILKQTEGKVPIRSKIPIIIDGKVVVSKTEDGKFHWFFAHENPNFIPVFFDLESSKLSKVADKEH